MQFTTIFATALLSTAALAAPTKRAVKAMAAADNAQWTFEGVTRACNSDDTSCNWSFGINANDGSAVTSCAYTVTGSPADQASETGVDCGSYHITSNWSGQFGPGKGFTTLAVVNGNSIAYPAYTDAELASGQAVSPDRSYPVQNIQ